MVGDNIMHRRRRCSTLVLLTLAASLVASPAFAGVPPNLQPDVPTIEHYSAEYGVDLDRAREILLNQSRALFLEEPLRQALGAAYAGYYYDNTTHQLVVPVASSSAAITDKARGVAKDADITAVETRNVKYSWAKLQAGQDRIIKKLQDSQRQKFARVGLNAEANASSVQISSGASAENRKAISSYVQAEAGAAVERTVDNATVTPASYCGNPGLPPAGSPYCDRPLRGGVRIDPTQCSAGFIAHNFVYNYVLSAGHCTNSGQGFSWTSRHQSNNTDYPIGPSQGSYVNFRGDAGTILLAGNFWSGIIAGYNVIWGYETDYPIRGVGGRGYDGLYACGSGSATGLYCGTIPAGGSDLTLTYTTGETVGHLFWLQSACVHGGDSGSPVDVANYGVGIEAAGDCAGAGAFYTPLQDALNNYGLSIYTG